jgi:glyoxylase-like metal-dependent hydrolase (beta-lactamase superfamily II)
MGGYDKNLSYLIWCSETKLAALIDPSVESYPIFDFIDSEDLILEKVLITHTHRDHIHYLDDFIHQYPMINIYCHSNPINLSDNYCISLEHNQVISIGKSLLTILYTPGHFADSICIWNKESRMIFTGDTVFIGRTGRVVSETSSLEQLYSSIYDIILKLPLKTTIYPGHHYGFSKNAEIDFNVKNSKFFQCKDIEEFRIVMEYFEKNRKK